MIDLNKLQAKFDAFFEAETEESYDSWLQDRVLREVISSLGEGDCMPVNKYRFSLPADQNISRIEIPVLRENTNGQDISTLFQRAQAA